MKKIIIGVSIIFINISMYANAYFFWLKSADNTIDNILQIEEKYWIHIPVISYIYDDRWMWQQLQLQSFEEKFGVDRIYHITLSPQLYSARQVVNGAFDEQYRSFFNMVKANNLKVIFRTMHEMNGGRYPWAGYPKDFIRAWRHVHDLSREVWLSQDNILFDFSSNHRDMPFVNADKWSQYTELSLCNVETKVKTGCITFEDYYPWDDYVDVVWFTFYNWGKGNSDRKWYTPEFIMNDPERNSLTRLRKFRKPLIIDEVATSAVWYNETYDLVKTQKLYKTDYDRKNIWIKQLSDFLISHNDILWAIYFNVDYTKWLTDWYIWEADWAIINMSNWKIYDWVFDLYNWALKKSIERTVRLFGQNILRNPKNIPVYYNDEDSKLLFLVRNILETKIKNQYNINNVLETLEEKFSAIASDELTPGQKQLFAVVKVLKRYYK